MCEEDIRIDEDNIVEERDGFDEIRDEVAQIEDQPVNTYSGDVTAEVDEKDETKKDTEKEQEEEKLTLVPKPKSRKQRNSSELGDVPPVRSGRPVPHRRSGRDRKPPDRLGEYVMYSMQPTGPYDTRIQAITSLVSSGVLNSMDSDTAKRLLDSILKYFF